ncbi:MAG: hypothetical protein ACTHJM_03895, partial [Marmoricola sp.]
FSLILDTLWLILMVPALAFIVIDDHHTLTWFMIAWAGSGALSGLIVLGRYSRAGLQPPMRWLRETWPYAWRYLASFVTNQGATLAASVGVGAIAGSAAIGALRGAQLLQRPICALQTAGMASGVGEIARIQPPERAAITRQTWRITALLTGAAALNLVGLMVLPDAIGRAVLGDSWHPAKTLLLPLNVQILLLCMTSGLQAAFLGLKFVRVSLRIDIITVAMLVIPPVIGTAMGGIKTGCWALTGGQFVALLIWWVTYLRADVTAPPLQRRSRGRHARV